MHHHGMHPPHQDQLVEDQPADQDQHVGPAIHGMLIVGEQTVYLSHLPMFTMPHHKYQAIFEVTFSKGGPDPQATYVKDRQQTGSRVYTLVPEEEFVLTELAPERPGDTPRRRSFKARIVRNHFERDETNPMPLASGVTVDIKHVVYFRELDPNAPRPEVLAYRLFGKGSALFLAHVIVRQPDFDQVLAAKVSGRQFTDDQLRAGVTVEFPGRHDHPERRLQEGERVSGSATVAGGGAPIPVEVEVGTQFYFELRDLA